MGWAETRLGIKPGKLEAAVPATPLGTHAAVLTLLRPHCVPTHSDISLALFVLVV